jgi:predicted methyltransferase
MFSRRLMLAAIPFVAVSSLGLNALAQSQPRVPPAPDPPALDDDPALVAAINGPQRSPANTARDGWRHPLQSLDFWGLAPGLTVIDIDPGNGYWTEILAPYLAQGGGAYIAGIADPADPNLSDESRGARARFAAKFSAQNVYGPIGFVDFTIAGGLVAPPASADMVLISREVHNLIPVPGALDKAMADFYAVLRPGGVLAIEEHRADPRPMVANASDGYVAEDFVIAAATKAGFVFQARSEINANPKDSKDHPFGVWTLPPVRRSAPEGQPADSNFDHSRFDAIGESDRMTLRFAKPG